MPFALSVVRRHADVDRPQRRIPVTFCHDGPEFLRAGRRRARAQIL
jgi:hypothetical protein